MSKALARRLRSLSTSSSHNYGSGADDSILDDIFGTSVREDLTNGNQPSFTSSSDSNGNEKPPTTIYDLESKWLKKIFEYLKEEDLKSVRLVSKTHSEAATEVFRGIHTVIHIDSEDKIFNFNRDMAETLDFPFSRFRYTFASIPRHSLITFTKAYNQYIKHIRIDPTPELPAGAARRDSLPIQRLTWKLIGVIQELTEVVELEITFPSLGSFDYHNLEFEKKFDLEHLKVLTIRFLNSGFCKFSSDLTLEILSCASDLHKLKLRLPEPTDLKVETQELSRVLCACPGVPHIGIRLSVTSSHNKLLSTIADIVSTAKNRRIKNLDLYLGQRCTSYHLVHVLLAATKDILISLRLTGSKVMDHPGWQSEDTPALRLPSMQFLKYLDIESHRIPVRAFKPNQFPSLIALSLNLRYGNEMFYQESCLHPLKRLKLRFHATSIMKVLIPDFRLENLISKDMVRLELINPPPGHLTFMSHYGKDIETLTIYAPGAYGEDPTYPVQKMLDQLRGAIQLRPEYLNNLTMLPNLKILNLLCPIDEFMAWYLVDMPRLWQLTVDDSKVSKQSIAHMRRQHHIYISWRHSDDLPFQLQ